MKAIIFDKRIRLILILVIFQSFAQEMICQMYTKWGDQGDGTYYNPVLPADYSDLDVIKVGEDYYAISSTMQYSPGMVVIHSKDLVNWKIISHVVDDLTRISPELNWDRMNSYGRGIWAGSIRYYKNKYWVYFGTPDDGFFMSSANNPEGPWEPLHQLWKVKGWDDCCSFCDDDGQLYFIATNFAYDPVTKKQYNIHLIKMTPDGKKLIMESDTIIHQSKGSEANKLYKINQTYYHFFSQVNQQGGRQVMMGRSNNLYGKWEIKQLNRVLQNRDREPNQGGLLNLYGDKWYFFTHHGNGDWEGRPASLLPVTWISGWPIIGNVAADTIGDMVWSGKKPINYNKLFSIQTNDDFNSNILKVQWEWNYQPRADKWSLTDRKGFLRLYAFKPIDYQNEKNVILRAGNTITQRSLRTSDNTVTIKIDISNIVDGQFAGLSHFSTQNNSLFGVKRENGISKIVFMYNDVRFDGNDLFQDKIWLRSNWDKKGHNKYFYSLDGKLFIPFGNETQLTWGSYRGDRIGIFNFNTIEDRGFIDVDWFRYDYSKN